jgi:hypothetical protein
MCHISSARVVRRSTFGFAGCTRSRGRRQPNFRTVVPGRGRSPNRAEPLREDGERAVGTCRYSSAVIMSLIAWTSGAVSRWGDVCGQDDRSSSPHACCRRCQAWNRLGDSRRNRRSARCQRRPKIRQFRRLKIRQIDEGTSLRSSPPPVALGADGWYRVQRPDWREGSATARCADACGSCYPESSRDGSGGRVDRSTRPP